MRRLEMIIFEKKKLKKKRRKKKFQNFTLYVHSILYNYNAENRVSKPYLIRYVKQKCLFQNDEDL